MIRSVDEHREQAPDSLRVAVLTVSDTRDEAEDTSGALIRELLVEAGHSIPVTAIIPDEPDQIIATVQTWLWMENVDAVVINGGTGISPRDQTPEAMDSLLDRRLDGFGELFRMLSHAEIGSAAMLSRASAGIAMHKPVYSIPGSRGAVRLAMTALILPEIGHVAFEARKGLDR